MIHLWAYGYAASRTTGERPACVASRATDTANALAPSSAVERVRCTAASGATRFDRACHASKGAIEGSRAS